MSRKKEKLPWHKLKTGKQNWIIIGISAFVCLLIIGTFSVLSR